MPLSVKTRSVSRLVPPRCYFRAAAKSNIPRQLDGAWRSAVCDNTQLAKYRQNYSSHIVRVRTANNRESSCPRTMEVVSHRVRSVLECLIFTGKWRKIHCVSNRSEKEIPEPRACISNFCKVQIADFHSDFYRDLVQCVNLVSLVSVSQIRWATRMILFVFIHLFIYCVWNVSSHFRRRIKLTKFARVDWECLYDLLIEICFVF